MEQPANPDSPGKMVVKWNICVCISKVNFQCVWQAFENFCLLRVTLAKWSDVIGQPVCFLNSVEDGVWKVKTFADYLQTYAYCWIT